MQPIRDPKGLLSVWPADDQEAPSRNSPELAPNPGQVEHSRVGQAGKPFARRLLRGPPLGGVFQPQSQLGLAMNAIAHRTKRLLRAQ